MEDRRLGLPIIGVIVLAVLASVLPDTLSIVIVVAGFVVGLPVALWYATAPHAPADTSGGPGRASARSRARHP